VFQYIWGGPEMVGVIAQEVAVTRPDAVGVGDGGYFFVDYEKLGIRMITREEFEHDSSAVYAPQANIGYIGDKN
jgi:hypothetical protein